MSKKETLGSNFGTPAEPEPEAPATEAPPLAPASPREWTDEHGQRWRHVREGDKDFAERVG